MLADLSANTFFQMPDKVGNCYTLPHGFVDKNGVYFIIQAIPEVSVLNQDHLGWGHDI